MRVMFSIQNLALRQDRSVVNVVASVRWMRQSQGVIL